jgi:CO/xanthine dehydrogenase FAD-binding subunit
LPLFRPREFVYTDDKKETLARLEAGGKHSLVIAGGTGFYELARRGYIPEVKEVVSIMKLGLDYVKTEENTIRIGATKKLYEILESGIGKIPGFEAIDDAINEIRPVQVRNVATVGGEICISVPIVDLPTALLACNASLEIMGSGGREREISLDQFYVDAFLTQLKYGEIVAEVFLPRPKENTRSAFSKIGRTAYDFNLINVAVSLTIENGSNKVESARVFLGGVKRTPFRALELEKKLVGQKIDEEKSVLEMAESSFSKEHFLPSVHGSDEYKRAILPILIRDCVLKARNRFS